ncbi:IS110 family transposase [Streptomyces sp. NBC_00704]|nr:transposase [Streptomyces sp. NBC_00704]
MSGCCPGFEVHVIGLGGDRVWRVRPGGRSDTAVALLITVGDDPERLDSETSFAALRGAGPVERSSGRRQHRRLNRGGDRQADGAPHPVVHPIVFTGVTSSAAPNATLLGRSSTWSNSCSQDPAHRGCRDR